jgi:hypothetical protein
MPLCWSQNTFTGYTECNCLNVKDVREVFRFVMAACLDKTEESLEELVERKTCILL